MKELDEAKEWSHYARKRFNIYGSEHSGVYFKPSMAKSLDCLDSLVVKLELLTKSLSDFKNDIEHGPDLLQYEKLELMRWVSGLLNDSTR